MRYLWKLTLLWSCLALGEAAHAQNLITDPGFESGYNYPANSWVETDQNFQWLQSVGPQNQTNLAGKPYAYDGNWFWELGTFSALTSDHAVLTQTVTTGIVAGQWYDFSFYAANGVAGSPGYSLQALINGVDVNLPTALAAAPATGVLATYSKESFIGLYATSNSFTIGFDAVNSGGAYYIDDVSLTPSASVPEPSTIAAMTGGGVMLGAMGLVYRRRRKNKQTPGIPADAANADNPVAAATTVPGETALAVGCSSPSGAITTSQGPKVCKRVFTGRLKHGARVVAGRNPVRRLPHGN